jgi:hypothetical protein
LRIFFYKLVLNATLAKTLRGENVAEPEIFGSNDKNVNLDELDFE